MLKVILVHANKLHTFPVDGDLKSLQVSESLHVDPEVMVVHGESAGELQRADGADRGGQLVAATLEEAVFFRADLPSSDHVASVHDVFIPTSGGEYTGCGFADQACKEWKCIPGCGVSLQTSCYKQSAKQDTKPTLSGEPEGWSGLDGK